MILIISLFGGLGSGLLADYIYDGGSELQLSLLIWLILFSILVAILLAGDKFD